MGAVSYRRRLLLCSAISLAFMAHAMANGFSMWAVWFFGQAAIAYAATMFFPPERQS